MRRFNPEKELYKIQHGRRDKILYSVIALLLIISIGSTYALYQVRYSKRIIYTKVGPFSSKDIELAVNIKDEGPSDRFPTQEELTSKGIKFTGIICDNDDVTTRASWNESEGGLDLFTSGPNKCTVNFGKTYTVKVEVESHGTVTPSTQEVEPNGTSNDFIIDLEEGYGIESITCTNNQNATKLYNTFKVENVTSDTRCTVKTSEAYTITAKVEGENGSVTPIEQRVLPGKDSEEFIVTTEDGYGIESVTCNNNQKVQRNVNAFKVENVTGDAECAVRFNQGIPLSNIIIADGQSILDDETDQHNLRYVGADPNNYIWFNCDDYNKPSAETCEKWRIIGLMNNVETKSNGEQSLVKIIRDEPLPNYYVWDNKPDGTGTSEWKTGSNNWADSRLMMLLNEGYSSNSLNDSRAAGSLYWNRKKGKCSGATSSTKNVSNGTTIDCDFTTNGLKDGKTKNVIETVKWKLGGFRGSKVLTSSAYRNERGSTTCKTTGNCTKDRSTEWEGKVGLMYPSDYGYSASNTCWSTELYNYNSASCKNNNWLYITSTPQWTIAPTTTDSYRLFYVNDSGYILPIENIYNSYASDALTVRPSLYLKSNVNVAYSEEYGGSTNPYVLVLN